MLTSAQCQLMKISATDMMMMCGAQGAFGPYLDAFSGDSATKIWNWWPPGK